MFQLINMFLYESIYKIIIPLIIISFISCKIVNGYDEKKITLEYEEKFRTDSLNLKFKGKKVNELIDYLGTDYNKSYSIPLHEPPGILQGWIFEYPTKSKYNYRLTVYLYKKNGNVLSSNAWSIEYAKEHEIREIYVWKHTFNYDNFEYNQDSL